MSSKDDTKSAFTRRAVLLGSIKAALGVTLLGRMYYLQIWKSEHYLTLAQGNSIKLELLPPQRGLILDRYGYKLATNSKNFRLVILKEAGKNLTDTLHKVNARISLETGTVERVLREIKRSPVFMPVIIKENLTWQEVSLMEVHAPDLPGVFIEEGLSRAYLYGERTAHILGYIQTASEEEAKDHPLRKLLGFKIGKVGIEKSLDETLQGVPGYREIEVNAKRRVIREINYTPCQPGIDVTLSIDIQLQNTVNLILSQQQSASAVVMKIHTGEVLALCSFPSFDPNLFTTGIQSEQWKGLLHSPYNPLTNKAVSGEYSPGSAFKMLIALAALESNIITPQDRVSCHGHMRLNNHRFHCWKKGGHGSVNVIEALATSCDVFFYILAQKIGIEKIAEVSRRCGLGDLTGIELPGEKAGLIPDKAWKKEHYGHTWTIAETILAGIGQGYLLVTSLQLALMVSRLVNGGKAVSPKLLFAIGNTVLPKEEVSSLGFKASSLSIVTEGMNQAVNGAKGTARGAKILEQGWEMGGKTSSTQVKRITMQERERGLHLLERPWKDRDHAMFVGFAPVHDPRYAVSVVVEHGGWGGSVAAPLGRDILLETQKRNKE
ncbi:MAG: penicillin-binding protein 2 [Alphaproteobacteria bacterium]|nr:penicillin-binding protein 2 [Alphaproteobacteria bacterium]